MDYTYCGTQTRQKGMGTVKVDDDAPETLRNPTYTPGYLREHIGKLVRVEFLIGTNGLTYRTGVLVEVGASYIAVSYTHLYNAKNYKYRQRLDD